MSEYKKNDMSDILFSPIRLAELESLIEKSVFKVVSKIQTQQIIESYERLYTLNEAANYCRMPLPTFRLHLSKRNVSGSKPGKKWIFTQEDLDKFLRKFHHKTKDEIRSGVDQTISSRKRRISHETTT